MKKILFICTGNICRSPTAHAIASHKAKELDLSHKFTFDSAGTDSYHAGELPDFRAVETGKKRGISFEGIHSRQILKSDFDKFDYLMCMDKTHYKKLMQLAKVQHQEKVKLFLQFCEAENLWNDEVIDPYYKDSGAFDEVFDVIDLAVEKLFRKIS
jgi:protein-tyrosine phosphatase